nr:hypothetical protein [Tricholoma matsutake]UIX25271.1 hypothetical protein [Tricholoma matsutake]UIX25299.1 hypothetical protein [Tricholoma matsutake]UIX25327.1 hypothetical protein [Tricholoma matsutake]UIX25355.1 hypothetical protein [Tricholoma matsutake]
MIKQIWKFYASQSIYFNIFNYNQYQYHPVLDRTELKTKKFFILAVRAFWEIKVNFLFILIKTKNNNRKNKRIGFKSLICKKKSVSPKIFIIVTISLTELAFLFHKFVLF